MKDNSGTRWITAVEREDAHSFPYRNEEFSILTKGNPTDFNEICQTIFKL